jgi:MFS family permease
MLCAVAFVLYIDRVNLMVAISYMKEEFGFSEEACGDILSAFQFGYAAGLVPGGWLADRFGPYRVLTVAGLSWSVCTVLIAGVGQDFAARGVDIVSLLFALRFLLGLCEACAFPTFGKALAHWVRRTERAQASGLIHSGAGLGGAFTPMFIVWVVLSLGWRESFLISGLVTLTITIAWARWAADDPASHPRVSPQELQIIAADKEEMRSQPLDAAWFPKAARSRNLYLLCASEFFYGLGGFVFLTWFFRYFRDQRHVDDVFSGFFSSCNWLAMAIGAPLGGLLCDRCVRRWGNPWGRRVVPLVSIVLSGLCSIAAPAIGNNAASAAVFALAAGLLYAAAAAFWSTLIDITRRGAGILGGLMNGVGSLGGALGTMFFARLIPVLDYQGALQCSGAMAVLSGLVWLGIDSSKQIDDAENDSRQDSKTQREERA